MNKGRSPLVISTGLNNATKILLNSVVKDNFNKLKNCNLRRWNQVSGCGVHSFHLLRYICSLSTCLVPGRIYLLFTGLHFCQKLRNFVHVICGQIVLLDLFNIDFIFVWTDSITATPQERVNTCLLLLKWNVANAELVILSIRDFHEGYWTKENHRMKSVFDEWYLGDHNHTRSIVHLY